MSKVSKKPYRGTRDFFPSQKRKQDYIFSKMRETAHLYGYEAYDGPLLEEEALYRAKSGDEIINEQIYSFDDRGNRRVAIRPEMTPTVARMVAQIHKEVAKPIRWFSIPNLMRYEKPQRGRLREHWQFNVDIFGAQEDLATLEIISLATNFLSSFGATEKNFEVLLNHRKVVEYLFRKKMNLEDEKIKALYKLIDKSLKISHEKFDQELKSLSIGDENEILFSQYMKTESLGELKVLLKEISFPSQEWDIDFFINKLKFFKLEKFIKFAPNIIRGLDYYTGAVFEIFDKHPDNRRAISGGGAYANLLQIFNETPLPGVGFGMGDVTLTDFLETHKLLPNDLEKPSLDLFLVATDISGQDHAISYSSLFRSCGIKTTLSLEPLKFKKIFSTAEKLGAKNIGIIGSQEAENNTIQIKNLRSKQQIEINPNKKEDLIQVLKSLE